MAASRSIPKARLSVQTVARIKRACKILRNPTIAEWLTVQPHQHSRRWRPFNVRRLAGLPLPDALDSRRLRDEWSMQLHGELLCARIGHDDEAMCTTMKHHDDEALSTAGPDSKAPNEEMPSYSVALSPDAQPGETRGQAPPTDATHSPTWLRERIFKGTPIPTTTSRLDVHDTTRRHRCWRLRCERVSLR
ncbi:hypothetical protein DFP72DRAFT_1060613 [Ephemerocybe angulata]|uniref:Uncharacterized protein n=1 Tax=Ephemerocybe angulata TaxID=980116 RepID=A0A8H6MF23_9AGAR|nr:hypothetical protein DFP72DRAFT_1060610 [Tulosesus angulatus]KAF6763462.1 hypothetical protein DFP72DRAFT_1060613 [Tulosesus angulatus]